MILLDTHALLWLYTDDPRLGPNARERISEATSVAYSPISVAELAIKHMLGRIDLPGEGDFPGVFERMGLVELPLTSAQAAALENEPALVRHDPFERFLLAQAEVSGRTLVTADRVLLALEGRNVLDARR